MSYNVTRIEFDFDDEQISKDERIEITNDNIGVWYSDDEDDLINEITDAAGWCIKSLDYHFILS